MGLMFDTVGYWFFLTWVLMTPIFTFVIVLLLITGARLESLSGGQTRLPLVVRRVLTKLAKPYWMLYFVSGWIWFVISGVNWMVTGSNVTYIQLISSQAEKSSPFFGTVFALLAIIVAYDFSLRVYIRVNNLIRKVESLDKK